MPSRDHSGFHPGTITAVTAQARDPGRVSVFVDGRFALGLPAEAAVQLGLRPGVELDETRFAEALRADTVYRAKQKALGLLAHRPRAVAEVADRLGRAGFEADVVDTVLSRLADLGYLDDRAFALAYARSRAAGRGYGSRRIHAELRRRGIDEETARDAVQDLEAERDPFEDALAAGRRAWSRVAAEADARRRRSRLYGHLARRGFDPDTIGRVIDLLERERP